MNTRMGQNNGLRIHGHPILGSNFEVTLSQGKRTLDRAGTLFLFFGVCCRWCHGGGVTCGRVKEGNEEGVTHDTSQVTGGEGHT